MGKKAVFKPIKIPKKGYKGMLEDFEGPVKPETTKERAVRLGIIPAPKKK